MNKAMYTIQELSDFLSISQSMIRKLVRNNDIPYLRIGSKLLFPIIEINVWLKDKQHYNG